MDFKISAIKKRFFKIYGLLEVVKTKFFKFSEIVIWRKNQLIFSVVKFNEVGVPAGTRQRKLRDTKVFSLLDLILLTESGEFIEGE